MSKRVAMRESGFRKWYRILVGLTLVGCVVGTAWAVSAPVLLNFQGRLTSPAGAPVTTSQTVRVSLFQGGTATELPSTGTLVYQEDTTVSPDSNGVFTHVIGSGTPVGGQSLTEGDFNTTGLPAYVELKIGAETLLPRTRLLSAAFAIEASRLDGKSASEIIGQAGGSAFANEVVRKGAVVEWISGTQIRVRPGTLGFSDAKVRKTTANLVWDAANPNGPLGLDTGSRVANTFYYLYAIPDAIDDSKFTAIASASAPTEAGGTGPTGHGVHRFVGSFRTDGASALMEFYRSGKSVDWRGSAGVWLYPGGNCTGSQPADSVNQWKTIDASAYMPLTSRAIHVGGYYDSYGPAQFVFYLTPRAGGAWKYFCLDWGNAASHCESVVQTVNRTFAYQAALWAGSNAVSQCTEFDYWGYEEDLSEF
jgi:hypothetical protein